MDEIISYKMCAVKVRSAKLRNYLRDQSLLMPGRGPEEILRGHKKILTSEGGARKYFEHEGGGSKYKVYGIVCK
jgi:hypothetical protein